MQNQENKKFNVKIAEVVFQVEPFSKDLEVYCAKFLTNDRASESVVVTKEDIEIEKELFKDYHKEENPKDYLSERAALLRKVSDILALKYNTVLFHCSSFVWNEKGYIFTARSGTGKSTHTRKWRTLIQDVVMINDDKPFLQFKDDQVTIYSSPWMGKEGIGNNISAPLAGIVCLEQAKDNQIIEMDDNEKWDFLFTQIYRSEQKEVLLGAMSKISSLMSNYPIVKLGCNLDDEAVQVSYEEIKKW